MKHKKLLLNASILTASLMMQACQSQKVPALPPIPASLLTPCSEYQSLSSNTMGELLTRYVESLEIGADCAAKVDAFIEIHKPSK